MLSLLGLSRGRSLETHGLEETGGFAFCAFLSFFSFLRDPKFLVIFERNRHWLFPLEHGHIIGFEGQLLSESHFLIIV